MALVLWQAPWVKSRARGDYASAEKFYRQSLHFKSAEQEEDIARLHNNLGFAHLHQDNVENAAAEFEKGFAVARQTGNRNLLACSHIGFAALAALRQNFLRAAELVGAADKLRASLRDDLAPADRAEYEWATATIRAHLQPETFHAAWVRGQRATPDQEPVSLPDTIVDLATHLTVI